jgi:heme/copper-type cytochrome/quinol oxidase subunit 3
MNVETYSVKTTQSKILMRGTLLMLSILKWLWIALMGLMILGIVLFATGVVDMPAMGGSWPQVALSVVYILAIFAFIQICSQIVASLGQGNPFTRDNSGRLRKLALATLVLGVLDVASDVVEVGRSVAEEPDATSTLVATVIATIMVSPALVLIPPFLFILARVFDLGIAMREDAEGTI